MLAGGHAAPVPAALVNGTLAHCLDYDDTHIESILHGSGPTWAAALAAGAQRNASERELLSAFITGFEVGTRVGNGGIGVRLNHSGWHTTCVLGRYSSAAAASALLGLDATQVKHALGIVATQVGGSTASVGTMSKPFHAGKTASDGVLAAELASQGFEGCNRPARQRQGAHADAIPGPVRHRARCRIRKDLGDHAQQLQAVCGLSAHACLHRLRLEARRVDPWRRSRRASAPT